MKKLLYIIVNSKPEGDSSSRKVSREFVNEFLKENPDYALEEINLYETYLPRLTHKHYECRNTLADELCDLTEHEKKDLELMTKLSDQFVSADTYVIAAPMWSILFPAPLTEYLNCVFLNGKAVKVTPEEVTGLLDNKERNLLYVQASGGPVPWLLNKKINHGGNYLHDIFKFLGIKKYEELDVDNTGFTLEERIKAEKEAIEKIPKLVKDLS